MSGIPIWLNVLLSLLSAAAGAYFGVKAHHRDPVSNASKVLDHSPHLWIILSSPMLLLIAHGVFHFYPDLNWALPYEVQYYYGPFSWTLIIGCFTYLAGFGAAVHLASNHPKRWQLGFAMALLFVALQQYHARATGHIPPGPQKPIIEFGVFVHQSTRSTCVAAAAATALNLMGDPRGEAEMIERMGTDYDGTSPAQLVMALRQLGYKEQTFSVERDGVKNLKAPAVLFVNGDTHAMTLVKMGSNGAMIWDPDRGQHVYTWDKLKAVLAGAHAIHFYKEQ